MRCRSKGTAMRRDDSFLLDLRSRTGAERDTPDVIAVVHFRQAERDHLVQLDLGQPVGGDLLGLGDSCDEIVAQLGDERLRSRHRGTPLVAASSATLLRSSQYNRKEV